MKTRFSTKIVYVLSKPRLLLIFGYSPCLSRGQCCVGTRVCTTRRKAQADTEKSEGVHDQSGGPCLFQTAGQIDPLGQGRSRGHQSPIPKRSTITVCSRGVSRANARSSSSPSKARETLSAGVGVALSSKLSASAETGSSRAP